MLWPIIIVPSQDHFTFGSVRFKWHFRLNHFLNREKSYNEIGGSGFSGKFSVRIIRGNKSLKRLVLIMGYNILFSNSFRKCQGSFLLQPICRRCHNFSTIKCSVPHFRPEHNRFPLNTQPWTKEDPKWNKTGPNNSVNQNGDTIVIFLSRISHKSQE